MPAVLDSVWSAADTRPAEIEEAIRRLVVERSAENPGFAPARALNLVCIVDKAWSGEIANRLRGVGRYHASRTIICALEPGRTTIDAVVSVASDVVPVEGQVAVLRENIVLTIGERHVRSLHTIVDPLVVTDIATVVWSPHEHPEAVDGLLTLAQSVLYDSQDAPIPREGLDRAREWADRAYVVDLAWLRTTPWRERVASTFDHPKARPQLEAITAVTVRHEPRSVASGLLLLGWFVSRLGWEPSPMVPYDGGLRGPAAGRRGDVELRLEPVEQAVKGLAGLTIETASGSEFSLDRAPGGLLARRRGPDGREYVWTVLGASRGEAGILGEGIRQALLRDAIYVPALDAAELLGA